MDNRKFEIILDSLLKRSEEGELDWKATGNQYVFLLVLKDSSISIERYVDGLIRLGFRDEKGNVIDETTVFSSSTKFEKAGKLFDLARRKALNADETINRILEQLNPGSIAA